MPRVPRRYISVPAVFAALPSWLVLTPVVVPITFITDLVHRRPGFPAVRLWLFTLVFVVHEWIGQLCAAVLWARGRFGRRLDHEQHRRMQAWWAGSLLRWARRLLHIELDFGDLETIPDGNLIVLSRHASMVDAILPAHLWPGPLGRPVHYVLKRELKWIPNIDVYASRLGNYFVDRAGDRDQETADIGRLAAEAREGSAIVIFPEGTYGTEANKARVQASLERRGDARGASLNRELRYLLPPKVAGTLALLAERPEAPVMVLGHVGLEGVAEISGLLKNLPAKRQVTIRWWVTDRRDLPTDEATMIAWVENQWRLLDRWVSGQLA